MRVFTCAAVAAAVVALTGSHTALAKSPPKPKPAPAAVSAPSAAAYGVRASYRTRTGKGYSARDRHRADCLATYPGAYDPASDTVRVRPGVTRPCRL